MIRTRQILQPVPLILGMVLGVLVLGAERHAQAAPAPERTGEARPLVFPDGVIDPQGRTAFVSSPKGGIQAIRLEDGAVLWTNDDVAARPWLVAGNRLVARGDGIFVLDLRAKGKLLRRCDAPAYPRLEVPERCTVSFNLWDAKVAGDTLEARWYAVANIDRRRGRPFPFAEWTAFNKAVPVGTVAINLDTGRAKVRTDRERVDVTMGLVPAAANPAQRLPAGLSDKLKDVWRQYHKDQNGRIAVVDARLVGVALLLEKTGNEYRKKVDLNAWSLKTGAASEPVELVKDSALAIANVMLTADRRHAAVQRSTAALTIYSLADGKQVAHDVKGVFSPENAYVQGHRLYSSEQGGGRGTRVLRAIDLKDGKQVWRCPLQPVSTIPLPP